MRADKLLDTIKRNEVTMTLYSQGMSYLEQAGIFKFLYELAKCRPADHRQPNYTEHTMFNAAYSMGYTQALDDLYEFRDKFLQQDIVTTPEPEYGGLEEAVAAGDLTEDEVNAIRSGQPIEYPAPSSSTAARKREQSAS